MKIEPEHHHITRDVVMPSNKRSVRPMRSALPIAQIYTKAPKTVALVKPAANRWQMSFRAKPKPAKDDKFTQRLSRLN